MLLSLFHEAIKLIHFDRNCATQPYSNAVTNDKLSLGCPNAESRSLFSMLETHIAHHDPLVSLQKPPKLNRNVNNVFSDFYHYSCPVFVQTGLFSPFFPYKMPLD